MKIKYVLGTVLLCLCLLLAGCTQEEPASDENSEQAYRNRIAALEQALLEEKEARILAEATHGAELKALQERLALLEGKDDTDVSQIPEGELVFCYRVENGKAIITGYNGSSTLVTVPALLDGYPVAAIGERAFEGKPVAAVVLPDGLEAVGWFAFYGCEELISVTFPSSVCSIGYAVFDGCPHVSLACPKGSYAAQFAASYGLPCILR